jgi:hypothetical protein
MNRVARIWAICATVFLLLSLAAVQGTTSAQDGTQATVVALQTQAAGLKTMVALQTEVAALSTQVGALGTLEPAGTPTPTPRPTPPPAGTVLYEANAENGGFEDWALAGGWQYFDGMLVNDGDGGPITAPYEPTGLANYAVEADIEAVQYDESYGASQGFQLFARSESVTAEFDHRYFETQVLLYFQGDYLADEEMAIHPREWHTFRLEVEGNSVRALIDANSVVAASDNRLIAKAGNKVGIWCPPGEQYNVASFRVIALGDR